MSPPEATEAKPNKPDFRSPHLCHPLPPYPGFPEDVRTTLAAKTHDKQGQLSPGGSSSGPAGRSCLFTAGPTPGRAELLHRSALVSGVSSASSKRT